MTLVTESERLPCGTPLDQLLAHLDGERSALDAVHAERCPHCRLAAAELQPGLRALRRQTSAPTPDVPSRVERAVLRRIRSARSGSGALALAARRPGTTTVGTGVIADLARIAAESVPGVVRAGTDTGDEWALRVGLTVRYGERLPDIAAEVRETVAQMLERQTGRRPATVDVVVEDLAVSTRG